MLTTFQNSVSGVEGSKGIKEKYNVFKLWLKMLQMREIRGTMWKKLAHNGAKMCFPFEFFGSV